VRLLPGQQFSIDSFVVRGFVLSVSLIFEPAARLVHRLPAGKPALEFGHDERTHGIQCKVMIANFVVNFVEPGRLWSPFITDLR
jgi:hypothetical protein